MKKKIPLTECRWFQTDLSTSAHEGRPETCCLVLYHHQLSRLTIKLPQDPKGLEKYTLIFNNKSFTSSKKPSKNKPLKFTCNLHD